MSKETAPFYGTMRWKEIREAYKRSRGGLCELCLERGIYKPGEIVHHKIHVTPDNMMDPSITMSFDNLQLVCRDCHARIHDKRKRRYKVDEAGRVIATG